MNFSAISLLFWLLLIPSFPVVANDNEVMTIVRGDEDYPPKEMETNSQLQGIHIDLTYAVAQNLNIGVRYISVPWKRALKMMQQGEADAISYISKTPEREQFAIFLDGNILSTVDFVFLILKENKNHLPYFGDVKVFLKDRMFLIQSGYSYGGKFQGTYFQKKEVKTLHQMVAMLERKRVDVIATTLSEFSSLYGETEVSNNIEILDPPIHSNPAYLAFSKVKGHHLLANRFSSEFKRLKKTPEYSAILRKYRDE